MKIFSSTNQLPAHLGATAVTIGKFDAIHLGHQKLFTELTKEAKANSLIPTVVTFDRHPDQLLRPDQIKLPIIGINQKRELMNQAGVELLLELEFNASLANLDPEEFIAEILVDGLAAKSVLVGEGFRFGKDGLGDCDRLCELGQKYGFAVSVIAPVVADSEIVSTTRVRKAMDRGEIRLANQMLGRTHTVRGTIEHGLKIGRKIGFPTANMARDAEGYLPLDGVYAGWLIDDGVRYPAAHSVGINETFQAVPRLVESHILDETEIDLYDKVVSLEFVDFVRPVAKFDGVDSLVAQINLDLEVVRKQLGLK